MQGYRYRYNAATRTVGIETVEQGAHPFVAGAVIVGSLGVAARLLALGEWGTIAGLALGGGSLCWAAALGWDIWQTLRITHLLRDQWKAGKAPGLDVPQSAIQDALALLELSATQHGWDGTQIISRAKSGWSAEKWTRLTRLIEQHVFKSGDGTFLKEPWTIRRLHEAIKRRQVPPTPPAALLPG